MFLEEAGSPGGGLGGDCESGTYGVQKEDAEEENEQAVVSTGLSLY